MVEFAMVVPLFFLLTFGMIDLGHVFFVQISLQNAMRQAGRFAVTGNHLTQGGTNLSRVASIVQIAQNAAVGLDVTDIQICSVHGGCSGATVGNTAAAGGPGDTVTITLTSNLQLYTPMIGRFFGTNGVYSFTVSTTFRNEPFDPKQAQ